MHLELRKGTKEDAQTFVDLLQKVHADMEHKEWFYLDPPEETKEKIVASQLQMWVAMDGDTMAAAFSVIFPGLEANNYGYDLKLSQEQLMNVVNMDTAAVHPDYRGMGLQKKLMQMAEQELQRTGRKILLCTIHPDNHHSLQNVLDQGYTIQAKRSKYGSIRYLLRKDIP